MKKPKLCITVFFIFLALSMNAHTAVCYESSILKPTPFMGHDGEIFKLSDGTTWVVRGWAT